MNMFCIWICKCCFVNGIVKMSHVDDTSHYVNPKMTENKKIVRMYEILIKCHFISFLMLLQLWWFLLLWLLLWFVGCCFFFTLLGEWVSCACNIKFEEVNWSGSRIVLGRQSIRRRSFLKWNNVFCVDGLTHKRYT